MKKFDKAVTWQNPVCIFGFSNVTEFSCVFIQQMEKREGL